MVTPAIFADVVAWPPGATAMDIAGTERQLGRRFRVIIGWNGAAEGYGIVHGDQGRAYAGLPLIGITDELIVVLGRTFEELIELIERTPPPWT